MSWQVVTYRLTGLDGEATEDVVNSLPDDDVRKDPEEEYALASVLVLPLSLLLALHMYLVICCMYGLCAA